MLAVRRLPPQAANALGYRIFTTLPAKFGPTGSVMAVMVMARTRQAITEPEVFPSLLDDAELRAAFQAYSEDIVAWETAIALFTMTATKAPAKLRKHIGGNERLYPWLRRTGNILEALRLKVERQIPLPLRVIRIPDIGFNDGKPFKLRGFIILTYYIDFILANALWNDVLRRNRFAAELARRGIDAK